MPDCRLERREDEAPTSYVAWARAEGNCSRIRLRVLQAIFRARDVPIWQRQSPWQCE